MAAVRLVGSLPQDGRGGMSGSQVHHLPCRIKHDGPAKVDTYFLPTELEDGKLEAAFRGRRLEGTVINLAAAGAVGVVFRETGAPTEAAMLPFSDSVSPTVESSSTEKKAEPANSARTAKPAQQLKPARGRGYGGGGGGYGFGGGGAVSDSHDDDENEDDEDDDEEHYALDFGGDEDEEAAPAAASSLSLMGGARRPSCSELSAPVAAACSEDFGRCWMRTWEVDRAFDSVTYW